MSEEIKEYNFSFGVGESTPDSTVSMKNIQLETLNKVIVEIKTKRIFLYTDSPTDEPEYVTVQDIINTINAEFDLLNTISILQTLISGLTLNNQRIGTLETDVNALKNSVESLNSSTENNTSQIRDLLNSINSILNNLSNVEIIANTNKNNIISLQDSVMNMQNQLTNVLNTINSNTTNQNSIFELMSWKNL